MIPSNTKNVIVFSQYRSGSTALCNFLGEQFNLMNFGEVFHVDKPKKEKEKYLNFFNNIPTIIKIPGNNITQIPIEVLKKIWDNSLIIRLTRKNFLLQSISWYSANASNYWTSFDYIKKDYSVPILPRSVTDKWIKNLHFQNHYVQSLQKRFDLEYCYENLNLSKSPVTKNKRHSNYDQLYDHVHKSVKKILKSCPKCINLIYNGNS